MHSRHTETWRNSPAEAYRRMENFFRLLADEGPDILIDMGALKFEGRYSADGKKIATYALRSYQLRVYGGWIGDQRKIFLCPEATIKKSMKADKDQLVRVAKKLGELT